MELSEQVTALTTELKAYKDHCEGLNAEKIALDQMLVENLKNSLASKKDVILKEEEINKLKVKIEVLNKEKEVYLKEIENLKNSAEVLVDLAS